ncbi:hypothetical protein PVK06_024842 [Gossypium arboreum]|uniref:Protein kinase domain-containing protein n=1 Tax=Gossypium arboreum TaxID=29729 RepID=A0ABR0PES8_GOSAR|nr:hypothetical protein PVK06_024842 [Gossypium arboreum]
MTARVSHSEFKYTFPVTLGQKFVLLYFHAASYKEYDRSKAFFPVKAGSFTLLKNFSASLVTNSKGRNWFPREFCLNVEDNEVLDLVFTPSRSASNDTYAFINGIEIVSMPTNLYYIQPDSQYVPFIGQRYPFPVENVTALEMAYRLNVGGQSLSPIDDTGLFRLWSDDFFYMTKNSYVTVNTSVPINYIMIQRYTAPEMVYRTARTIGPSLTYNEKHNLSWRLLVGSGFKYMVRLHFCEPQDLINSPGDRTFKVSINSQTAEENADVLMWTRHGRVPIFKDYVVFVSKEYITIDFILFIILSAKSKKRSLLIACVGCVASLITIISLLVCMVVRRQRKGTSWLCWWVNQNEGKSTRTSLLPDELCRYFSLDEIKATTNNFHDDLVVGKCGFGKVFKGFIDEGEKIVAIKRLNLESSQGIGEFLTEIEMLFQLRHQAFVLQHAQLLARTSSRDITAKQPCNICVAACLQAACTSSEDITVASCAACTLTKNIIAAWYQQVSLIRYCNEKQEMILLYDFMSNGTLSDHLYSTSFAYDSLIWKQRLEICNGAVIGLNYLHTEVRHTIIHRDVKTSNILLDDKFTVKVSDFGLSKEDPKDEMLITGIKGTCGYMDPDCKYEIARISNEPGTLGQAMHCRWDTVQESCIADVGTDRPSMNGVMERLGFAIELQMAADAEMSKMDPASECSYLDIVFLVARDMDFNDESKVDSELDSNVCRGVGLLDSDTNGLTYPTIGSSTSMYTFFSTINNTKSIGN